MTETPAAQDYVRLERLVFFSDAIFAIAITLLVIEIHVPHLTGRITEQDLADALLGLLPQYIGFLVSFFVIGRFWIGHHRTFGWLARADDTLIWRNLLFLMTIAFMPFPTAVLSNYAGSRVGVGLYAGWLMIAGLLNMWTLRHATAGPLLAEPAPPLVKYSRGVWIPIVTATLALAGMAWDARVGLIALLLSPLIGRVLMWQRRRSLAA